MITVHAVGMAQYVSLYTSIFFIVPIPETVDIVMTQHASGDSSSEDSKPPGNEIGEGSF